MVQNVNVLLSHWVHCIELYTTPRPILAPFGFSDSIATFALWVFYGRFGCLLLLVWKTWQHSVLGLQYLTWQLMSTSIVGSFNGKNWINQQVTILVCTHRCYVYVRVPLCSDLHCNSAAIFNSLQSLILLPRRSPFMKSLKRDAYYAQYIILSFHGWYGIQ